ncbi:MAG: hypothetical protein WCD18_11625 [Thermosynechococcaceae cyanobacterium]
MARIYTTHELAQILRQEQAACLRGDRLNLTTTQTRFNPVVDPFVNVEGIQKFRAFCDFRDAVHAYQQEHQVSGLTWRTFVVNGQSIHYPEVNDNLIALPQDLEILKAHKGDVLVFWQTVTQDMDLYRQVGKHFPHCPVSQNQVEAQAQTSEWAYLHKLEYGGALEMTLQLGWGNPQDALFQKYWPLSGCCFIHGVEPSQMPRSTYF